MQICKLGSVQSVVKGQDKSNMQYFEVFANVIISTRLSLVECWRFILFFFKIRSTKYFSLILSYIFRFSIMGDRGSESIKWLTNKCFLTFQK